MVVSPSQQLQTHQKDMGKQHKTTYFLICILRFDSSALSLHYPPDYSQIIIKVFSKGLVSMTDVNYFTAGLDRVIFILKSRVAQSLNLLM